MPTIVTPAARPSQGSLAALPLVEPIPLVTRIHAFDDPDWIFEPQYEGMRAFLYAAGGDCEIRSASSIASGRMPELCERIVRVVGQRETILDGEVVSLDRQGKPSLRDLIRGEGYLAFGAFDILWLDGEDLRTLPLLERRRYLAELLPEDTGPLYKMLTLDEFGRALYSAIRKMDLAGIVAKRKQDPYDAGTTWYQILNPGHRLAGGQAVRRVGGRTSRRLGSGQEDKHDS